MARPTEELGPGGRGKAKRGWGLAGPFLFFWGGVKAGTKARDREGTFRKGAQGTKVGSFFFKERGNKQYQQQVSKPK